ncbi:hypothetical protein thalar_02440 [Litoreibacter arenae DSM 19593]|uniref:Uncharacterized protein n=1 Tax=Litoreibacter arenae DSM 19593 TaxID=1123360 RepID=S9QA20_9RHOB|nr:hypothetical protein thalar_02440 [Litoreibacter arenae DSM 19593]
MLRASNHQTDLGVTSTANVRVGQIFDRLTVMKGGDLVEIKDVEA